MPPAASHGLPDEVRNFVRVVIAGSVVVLASLFCSCGVLPRSVDLHDPELAPLLTAAKSFDRESYGFSTLPRTGQVGLEIANGVLDRWVFGAKSYDAMLHFGGKTGRTIAFQKRSNQYVWVGEQEMFTGPKEYRGEDGPYHEQVTLTYETVRISGFPINQLAIDYTGEDPRLESPKKLTLAEVRPILREWGY